MGKESYFTPSELGEMFGEVVIDNLPTASNGQLDAAVQIGEILATEPGDVTICAVEGVGGAGKSEMIGAIRPSLENLGVTVVPDEVRPADFRTQHRVFGPILATGRVFGDHRPDDILVKVKGFSKQELMKLLGEQDIPSQLVSYAMTYAMGSARLARAILMNIRDYETSIDDMIPVRRLCSRTAAQFLLDRIPRSRIEGKEYDAVHEMVRTIYREYVPDEVEEGAVSLIAMNLFELHNTEFRDLENLLYTLGVDPSQQEGRVNVVDAIQSIVREGDEVRLCGLAVQINPHIRKAREENVLRIAFPLADHSETESFLQNVIVGNREGRNGIDHEPRLSIVAAVPSGGVEREILETCLTIAIDQPLSHLMRKTALAVIRDNDALYHFTGDMQFFSEDSFTGKQEHKFFNPPFPEMKDKLIGSQSGEHDILYFVSGDHNKVPLVPSMIITVLLESILQQLGHPYIVRYVGENREKQFPGATHHT